jgi:hypothetical protein
VTESPIQMVLNVDGLIQSSQASYKLIKVSDESGSRRKRGGDFDRK